MQIADIPDELYKEAPMKRYNRRRHKLQVAALEEERRTKQAQVEDGKYSGNQIATAELVAN